MHTDARTLEDGTTIEGDLCIVGAGAAGISLALEWIDRAENVILLEGGGFEVDSQMQDLYKGLTTGQPYYPLHVARIHAFGGTTGHWAGMCAPFDPIDFEARDWVPHSGWPLSRGDLDPFYARACKVVELTSTRWESSYWTDRETNKVPLPLDADVVWTKMWQMSPPTRFGTEYRDEITGADNVHLYTYANAVEVEANESVTAVDGLRLKTPNGKEHRARARHYVLACGSIQNARLLLASTRQASNGLGNEHDLVGRHFMEHIEMPGGQLVLAEPQPISLYMTTYFETKARGELALTAPVQREHQILNGTVTLEPGTYEDEKLQSTFQEFPPDRVKRFFWEMSLEELKEMVDSVRSEAPERPSPSQQRAFKLVTRQEQTPNPHSRITLGDDLDAMGMPRVELDWQFTPLDKRSMRSFYEILGHEMGKRGIGRVQVLDWLLADDTSWPDFVSGGWHHMGTTRMHPDPTQGVVDPNCTVHGLDNLHVAGSAVYPTAGAANPTLTLIAMTLRLSDHLKAEMRLTRR